MLLAGGTLSRRWTLTIIAGHPACACNEAAHLVPNCLVGHELVQNPYPEYAGAKTEDRHLQCTQETKEAMCDTRRKMHGDGIASVAACSVPGQHLSASAKHTTSV